MGLQRHCSTPPGSPPLGPAGPKLRMGLPDTCPARVPAPVAPPGPAMHETAWIHTLLGSPPLEPSWTPAPCGTTRSMLCPLGPLTLSPARLQLHVGPLDPCPAITPTPPALPGPGSTGLLDSHSTKPCSGGHHRRAPNLPKKHRQTGLDTKRVTKEQLRLKFYWSRTNEFFLPFFKGLAAWFAV
jgi:hypothetical protein